MQIKGYIIKALPNKDQKGLQMSPNPTRKDIIQAIITNPTLDEEQKSLFYRF